MEPKFKIGDNICIGDEEDSQYTKRGFYGVVAIFPDGYDLYSFSQKKIIPKEAIQWCIDNGKKSDHADKWQYDNVLHFIDSVYRLLSKAEVTLYGSDRI